MRTLRASALVAVTLVTLLGASGAASAQEAPAPPPAEGGGAPAPPPAEGGGAPAPPPAEGGAPAPAPPPAPEKPEKTTEECIKLLQEGGKVDDCQEAPNPILPATNELLWGFLSFMVLFLLMAKLALPGVRKSMGARTEKIRNSLDEAERTRTEAQAVMEDYQRQLADAKGEAGRIIDEARETADKVKTDLMARAESEAEEQRKRNADQIAAERDRVMSELQSQVASLAFELAEKVVESSLDRDMNMRLIEDYINSVGSNGDDRAGAVAAPRGPGGGT